MKCVTATTASLAARATMSAQDTTPGQRRSSSDLALSITSKPPTPALPGANLSSSFPACLIRIDPSQPYRHITKPIYVGNLGTKTP